MVSKPLPNLPTAGSPNDFRRPLDIPIDAHPGNVKGESPLLNDAREVQQTIYGVWTKINEAKSVQDKRRLADTAQQAVERSLRGVEPRLKRLRENFFTVDARIDGVVRPKAPDAIGVEIRSHMKARGNEALTTVSSLINQGDKRSVAAVLTAPPFLSGLTDKQHETLLDMARRRFCPEDCELLSNLERAIDRGERSVEQLTDTIAPLVREWRGEDENKLKELEAHA